jgi:hypothetical protein
MMSMMLASCYRNKSSLKEETEVVRDIVVASFDSIRNISRRMSVFGNFGFFREVSLQSL